MIARRGPIGFEEPELACCAAVEQAARAFIVGLETEPLGIEPACTLEIAGWDARYDATVLRLKRRR